MAGTFDILAQERIIGNSAAATLRRNFKEAITMTATMRGDSKKSTVRARYRQGYLDRLTFVAPYYIYMQHNGFEGSKKNGVKMRLRATDVVNIAIEKSNILEKLATQLAENRMEEVISKIRF